jgi:GT2 family glycosyltransferase
VSDISLIIPVKPGYEPLALQNLKVLDWPANRFELLIVEGTNPSRQRNEAARQAKGAIVYFLDDDSLVVTDALQRLTRHFDDPHVIVVGGPSLTPASDTFLQRAIGVVLSSLLGAGGARNRYRAVGAVRETTERELILCNLAIRRDAFLAAGGLDERLYPNEENELLDRLLKQGGKLLHDPALSVERSQRKSLFNFIRQMFRYGRGRAEQTRIAGLQGLMPFVPLFFVLYLLSLPLVAAAFWFLPLLVYGTVCIGSALYLAVKSREPFIVPLATILFPLLHGSNGVGLLAGFLLPLKRQTCYKDQPVTVRRLKLESDQEKPGAVQWI